MKQKSRAEQLVKNVLISAPCLKTISLFIVLWLIVSEAMYIAGRGMEDTSITFWGQALYWTKAVFSTADIVDTPVSGLRKLIG